MQLADGSTAETLAGMTSRFGSIAVAVVGESILDSYLEGAAVRLSREGPVPVVALERRLDAPGGAANAARNAAALGARVRLVSAVGDDDEGERLRSILAGARVDVSGVRVLPGRRTLAKARVVADGRVVVRFDQGDAASLDADGEHQLAGALAAGVADADVVLVSCYGSGLLTPALVDLLARERRRRDLPLVVDARDLRRYRALAPSAVTPSYEEAVGLLAPLPAHAAADRASAIEQSAPRLLELTGARVACVTLDSEGALVLEGGRPPHRTYVEPVDDAFSAGAGDTFAATLTLALAAGAAAPGACELASAAACVAVAKEGTAACGADELRRRLTPRAKVTRDAERLASELEGERRRGRPIVLTSGCFDILHRGHVSYLTRAKALGGVLVVAVNGDASVRALKGPGRPINTLADRVEVLAGLSCVDRIVPFEAERPSAVIEALRPDVFVKGGDYARGGVPEARLVESLGGRVELLPYEPDVSTTAMIETIRELERAEPVARVASGERRRR